MNKISKKPIIISAALCALLAIGGSLAYFTDNDAAQNQLEIGEVKIDLTEPIWDEQPAENDNDIPDDAENIVPCQEIQKDPMVTNKGVNDAYIFLKVTVPKADIYTAQEDGTKNDKAVTQLFDFTSDSDWTLLSTDTSDSNVNVYVYGYNYIVSPEDSTSKLFESVTFCNAIEGQGLENTIQNIDLEAYGIQSDYTGTMQEAYTKYVNQNK